MCVSREEYSRRSKYGVPPLPKFKDKHEFFVPNNFKGTQNARDRERLKVDCYLFSTSLLQKMKYYEVKIRKDAQRNRRKISNIKF